jgi:serine/threonine protein kinase
VDRLTRSNTCGQSTVVPMSKLKSPIVLQTAFGEYTLDEILGEGGAGRVYGGVSASGEAFAVKSLTQSSLDKRRRFKNEIAFLLRNAHQNIVTVTDHGFVVDGPAKGPFYVMRRYSENLRSRMKAPASSADKLRQFLQILDGVEAAHLLKVVHRDLKPENVLFDKASGMLAVADFGVAKFTEETIVSLVETDPRQRLANFQYAAPEQRVSGQTVNETADIYALGLMLNELFTSTVPHGTDYKLIASVDPNFAYLDKIVSQMLKQSPNERPRSILQVKQLLQQYELEAVTLQKLDRLNSTVIPAGAVDEPLAHEPPNLVAAEWNAGVLTLTLDRDVRSEWVSSLLNMGNYSAVYGKGPETFRFNGDTATVAAEEHDAQSIIDHFKVWLPRATQVLKQKLEDDLAQKEARAREDLKRRRLAEEQRLRVNQSLKI